MRVVTVLLALAWVPSLSAITSHVVFDSFEASFSMTSDSDIAMGYFEWGLETHDFYILGKGSGYAKASFSVAYYPELPSNSEGSGSWTLNGLDAGSGYGGGGGVNVQGTRTVPIADLSAKQELQVVGALRASPRCIHFPGPTVCFSNTASLNTQISLTFFSDKGKQLGVTLVPPKPGGDPTPVPEPATWATMVVAAGAIGTRKRFFKG